MKPRLGVNIDHIATLRQLRGTPYPDLLSAARIAERAGAEQITVHLREDRRHIQEEDVLILRSELKVPLNLEMAASPAMLRFASKVRPDWACLVPEKRRELTTEGGLDVRKNRASLEKAISQLKKVGIRVSCFIEPDLATLRLCRKLGADAVEFHTGRYCLASQNRLGVRSKKYFQAELNRIQEAAVLGHELGLGVHAGHGLDDQNIRPLAELETLDRSPLIQEYNIGHFIVCRAVQVGLGAAVREMVSAICAP